MKCRELKKKKEIWKDYNYIVSMLKGLVFLYFIIEYFEIGSWFNNIVL